MFSDIFMIMFEENRDNFDIAKIIKPVVFWSDPILKLPETVLILFLTHEFQ